MHWIAGAVAVLTACGGGGGGISEPGPTGTPTEASAGITLSGTAAKGAALGGAVVDAKCAAGTGTAITGSDGRYSLTLSQASLPCALRVTGTEGSVFHSLVTGSGGGAYTANLSPLTDLLVARAAAADPALFFASFNASAAPAPAAMSQALEDVRRMTAGLLDLSSANPVSDPLVAAHGLTAGNDMDRKIDVLMTALATAQITLPGLSRTLGTQADATSVVSTLLQPTAADCNWLRSGRYRMINPYVSLAPWRAHPMDVDARTLNVTLHDGTQTAVTSQGGCMFTAQDPVYTNHVMISSGGMMVVYSQSRSTASDRKVSLGLPMQALPATELAGTWQLARWLPTAGNSTQGLVARADAITFNANGQISAINECLGAQPCTAAAGPFPTVSAPAADGGFDLVQDGAAIGTLHLYKAITGHAVFVYIGVDGEFMVGTRQAAETTLPVVGTVQNFREFTLQGNKSVSALLDQSVRITATDAQARTVTRLRASDVREERVTLNAPRDGLRHRAADACSVYGEPTACPETLQLPLPGMGVSLSLSASSSPGSAFFSVAVNKPD